MSMDFPLMALGLPIYNGTFSIPGDQNGKAAGWDFSAGSDLTATGMYDDPPPNGHSRYQRLTLSGTGKIYGLVKSAPIPNYLTTTLTENVVCAVLYRATGVSGSGQEVYLTLNGYDSSDTLKETLTLVNFRTPQAGWTFSLTTPSLAFGSGGTITHRRAQIVAGRPNDSAPAITFDIAAFHIGVWDTTNQYFTFTTKPGHPGSEMLPTSRPEHSVDAGGNERFVWRDKFRQPRRGSMVLNGVSDTMHQALLRAWRFNHGRYYETGGQWPEPGQWPILMIPRWPSFPDAVLCNFDGNEYPMRTGTRWFSNPPRWSGELSFTEELGRV